MRHLFILCMLCGISTAQLRPPATPEPTNSNLPANLPAQPIGANDLLTVSVYDAPELSRSVRVGADGDIRVPMLKQRIKAEGLLPDAVEKAISQALKEEGILVDPVVTVAIAEYHSRPISVAGAVRTPITFQAVGPMTLLQAIAKAGGLEKNAGPEILVTRAKAVGRAEATTINVPAKLLINDSDPKWNLLLEGGEQIRIPEAGRIFVVGNLKKPGAFSSAEVNDATVLKAVALGEGLLPFSSKQAFIYRPDDAGKKQEIPIDLARILERKTPDVALQPNDILYVPDNKHRKMTAAAVERILTFGSTAGATALIYGR